MDVPDNKEDQSPIFAHHPRHETSPECVLASILEHFGFLPQRRSSDLPGSVGLVLEREKIVIFANTCFWHGHEQCGRVSWPTTHSEVSAEQIAKNKRRDLQQRKRLRKQGYHLLTFWTCKPISCAPLRQSKRGHILAFEGSRTPFMILMFTPIFGLKSAIMRDPCTCNENPMELWLLVLTSSLT